MTDDIVMLSIFLMTRRGYVTKPRVGPRHEGLPWVRFKNTSTPPGLCHRVRRPCHNHYPPFTCTSSSQPKNAFHVSVTPLCAAKCTPTLEAFQNNSIAHLLLWVALKTMCISSAGWDVPSRRPIGSRNSNAYQAHGSRNARQHGANSPGNRDTEHFPSACRI